MPKKHLIEAISTLIGFTIGAGILGIPFVVARAGFLIGILNILVIGITILILNLYLGEITLRTKGIHQLTGYARIYLGKIGNYLMTISFIIFSYGALTAYILKTGEFLNALFSPIFGGTIIIYSLIFFVISFIITYEGIRIVERSEVFMVIFIFVVMAILTIFAIPHLDINNLNNLSFNIKNFFIPYGVVFFAFVAMPAIPEMNEELKNNKRYLKKAIIIGSLIPMFIYILFALIMVGVTGINTTDGAILGLAKILGNKVLIFGSILGILTMATSFVAVAFALTEMYHFDYKLKKKLSSVFACFISLIISLVIINSNIKNAFFKVLDVTGILEGPLVGVLIVMIWYKAKRWGKREPEFSIQKNDFLNLIIILMLIIGTISRIYEMFLA